MWASRTKLSHKIAKKKKMGTFSKKKWMNLVEKYFIGFEPMTSVLPRHYSTTKRKALYRIWTDDLCLTMALLYHWVKRAFYSIISHFHLPLWVYCIMYILHVYIKHCVYGFYVSFSPCAILKFQLGTDLWLLLVPAFEQACKTMFEQVDGAFQKGMSEQMYAIQQQVEAAHTPLALTLKVSSSPIFDILVC